MEDIIGERMRISGMTFQHDGFEMEMDTLEIDDALVAICPMNSPEEFISGELRWAVDEFWQAYLKHKEKRERGA